MQLRRAREPVLLPLCQREDIGPLHPQGTTYRAVAGCAECSLHRGTSRDGQAQNDFRGSRHVAGGHCEIQPYIVDCVEGSEASVAVFRYAATAKFQAVCNCDRSSRIADGKLTEIAVVADGEVCAAWGHDGWC